MPRKPPANHPGLSSRENNRRIHEDAARAFAKHEIRERSDGRWVIQQRYNDDPKQWSSTYWAEIIVLRGGKLLVQGDIKHVLFEGYGRYDDPEQVLRWMGCCSDFSYYVHQKAVIGTGTELIDKTDDEVALWDLHEKISDRREEIAGECQDPDYDGLDGDLSRLDLEEASDSVMELRHRFAGLSKNIQFLDGRTTTDDLLAWLDKQGAALDPADPAEVMARAHEKTSVHEGMRLVLIKSLEELRDAVKKEWTEKQAKNDPAIRAYEEALEELSSSGDVRAAIEVLSKAVQDPDGDGPKSRYALFEGEDYYDIGKAIDARLHYAYAALRKLCSLLDAELAVSASPDATVTQAQPD